MQKKLFLKLCLMLGFSVGLVSCSAEFSTWGRDTDKHVDVVDEALYNDSFFNGQSVSYSESVAYSDNPLEAARVYNKRIPPLNSLVVCRSKQCAPAELSMSREYIYNSLAHLIDNNLDSTALLCEANPQAHVCTNPYITVPAKVGVTPAYAFFDGVKIVDASAVKGKTALNLALGYNLSYNGQVPSVCKPDTAMLYVKDNNNVVLNGNGFKCDMTSMGTTLIRVMFNIDYIDLDYGYIGGYYSIGLSGPANGGGSGYGLIRLVKDAHPLNPELMGSDVKQDKVMAQDVYKPDVKKLPSQNIENNSVHDNIDANQRPSSKADDEEVINDLNVSLKDKNSVVEPEVLTPTVKGDKIIYTKPDSDKFLVEVGGESSKSAFEETSVDDLDEYIK